MNFALSPSEAAFQAEIRAWLAANLPPDWDGRGRFPDEGARVAFLKAWQARLHAAGFVGLAWPREYGGRGATIMEQAIFYEELARHRAPELINLIGLDMAGPAIIAHGSEAQKRRYLPRILSAEEIWCQGFSEPNAGSDLAALETRAVRGDGHFVVTGQKVWTSFAHYAEWCILLARTDPGRSKHAGLTYLLLDMRSPGVSVRPLRQLTGDAEFNEIFFDGVRVPVENVLGEVNGGWAVAITTLMFERGPRTLTRQVALRMALDALLAEARSRRSGGRGADDPVMRQRLARLFIDAEALRLTTLRGLTRMLRGEPPGPEGSVAKLFWSETWQRVIETMIESLGPAGLLTDGPRAPGGGVWASRFLRSRGDTIAAGTSEIQRNIIGERVLGLPKE